MQLGRWLAGRDSGDPLGTPKGSVTARDHFAALRLTLSATLLANRTVPHLFLRRKRRQRQRAEELVQTLALGVWTTPGAPLVRTPGARSAGSGGGGGAVNEPRGKEYWPINRGSVCVHLSFYTSSACQYMCVCVCVCVRVCLCV